MSPSEAWTGGQLLQACLGTSHTQVSVVVYYFLQNNTNNDILSWFSSKGKNSSGMLSVLKYQILKSSNRGHGGGGPPTFPLRPSGQFEYARGQPDKQVTSDKG